MGSKDVLMTSKSSQTGMDRVNRICYQSFKRFFFSLLSSGDLVIIALCFKVISLGISNAPELSYRGTSQVGLVENRIYNFPSSLEKRAEKCKKQAIVSLMSFP